MSEASDEASSPKLIALENAWSRFGTFDLNANVVQRQFFRLRISILAAGVAATALAIIYSQYVEKTVEASVEDSVVESGEEAVGKSVDASVERSLGESLERLNTRPVFPQWQFFAWLLMMAMPIVGSVLAAGAAKFARGVDWINLRGTAEAIKREIYRYRCGVGVYSGAGAEPGVPEEHLAEIVGEVSSRLMDSEVLNASLLPIRGNLPPKNATAEGDDGFSPMAPEQYLEWRLEDQHKHFNSKAGALDRQHRVFQWTIAALGGAGTLFAALGVEIWVPVAVAVATALASYLAFRNVETNLAGYNRADLELDNVATWWSGLPATRKADPAAFATLVDRTETVLGSENSGWAQQMQHAMDRLKEKEKE